jgi:hypothetical protein
VIAFVDGGAICITGPGLIRIFGVKVGNSFFYILFINHVNLYWINKIYVIIIGTELYPYKGLIFFGGIISASLLGYLLLNIFNLG